MLLSHFSRVRLCATPQTTAQEAPPPLGFSRQEHWSGLPFPSLGFPYGSAGKEFTCQYRRHRRRGLDPSVGKFPWRRKWQPTPVFLLGNPVDRGACWATVWGCKELDMTEQQSMTGNTRVHRAVFSCVRKFHSSLFVPFCLCYRLCNCFSLC